MEHYFSQSWLPKPYNKDGGDIACAMMALSRLGTDAKLDDVIHHFSQHQGGHLDDYPDYRHLLLISTLTTYDVPAYYQEFRSSDTLMTRGKRKVIGQVQHQKGLAIIPISPIVGQRKHHVLVHAYYRVNPDESNEDRRRSFLNGNGPWIGIDDPRGLERIISFTSFKDRWHGTGIFIDT